MSNEPLIDEERRRFLVTGTCAIGGIGALCAGGAFMSSLMPSASARLAGAPVQVDLRNIEPGQQLTVAWRGKPVWILRRTPQMLAHLNTDEARLRDPYSRVDQQPAYAQNTFRSINPEYLVLVGLCTHLGCSPQYKPCENKQGTDSSSGFYCPCHGSRFDLSGRVFKSMPAPVNMQVPPYRFMNEHTIVIGEDTVV